MPHQTRSPAGHRGCRRPRTTPRLDAPGCGQRQRLEPNASATIMRPDSCSSEGPPVGRRLRCGRTGLLATPQRLRAPLAELELLDKRQGWHADCIVICVTPQTPRRSDARGLPTGDSRPLMAAAARTDPGRPPRGGRCRAAQKSQSKSHVLAALRDAPPLTLIFHGYTRHLSGGHAKTEIWVRYRLLSQLWRLW
jgi:hypothetical protein